MIYVIDSIVNPLTSAGLGKDATFDIASVTKLNYEQLRRLYHGTALARKAVKRPVRDLLIRSYRLESGREDFAATPEWRAEAKRLRINKVLERAACWARAFGVARVFADVDDGRPFSEPMGPYSTLKGLHVFDGYQLLPASIVTQNEDGSAPIFDFASFKFYQAESRLKYSEAIDTTHRLSLDPRWREVLEGKPIHASRIFTIVEHDVQNADWVATEPEATGMIQGFYTELCHRVALSSSAVTLASEARIDGIKSPSLEGGTVDEGSERYIARMQEIAQGKSLLNMLMLANNEEYFSRQIQLNGVSDLANIITSAFVAAAEIPESILYEKGVAGVGSDSIEVSTYSNLQTWIWQNSVAPLLEWAFELAYKARRGPWKRAKRFPGVLADRPVTYTESPKDEMGRRMIFIQSIVQMVGAGILPPEYAAEMWKGPTGFTYDMPQYDPSKYPPPVRGGGSNVGSNAPWQPAPSASSSAVGTGMNGEDPRPKAINTGTENQ